MDTPIHIATKHNDITMVAILLKFKADINAKNLLNKSALDIAKKHDDLILVNMMKNMNALFGI